MRHLWGRSATHTDWHRQLAHAHWDLLLYHLYTLTKSSIPSYTFEKWEETRETGGNPLRHRLRFEPGMLERYNATDLKHNQVYFKYNYRQDHWGTNRLQLKIIQLWKQVHYATSWTLVVKLTSCTTVERWMQCSVFWKLWRTVRSVNIALSVIHVQAPLPLVPILMSLTQNI